MKEIDVFDPPMCCATGVCGAEVDSNLVQFAADLEWLKARGVTVRRFNLAQEPQAFMNQPEILKAVSIEGTQCLPLIVVDGKIASRRTYPTRDQLAVFADLSKPKLVVMTGQPANLAVVADATSEAKTCCTPAGSDTSGCCSR